MPQPVQQRRHRRRALGAEPRHRLVHQEGTRGQRQRHRDLELPPLAVRQRGGLVQRLVREPDALQRGHCYAAQLRVAQRSAPHRERAPLSGHRAEHGVLQHAVFHRQRRDLVGPAQPEQRAPRGVQAGHVLAGQPDGARVRALLSGDLLDQRGLAGAVRPDQRVDLALRQVQRDLARGDHGAVGLADPPDLEHRLSHAAPPRRPARSARRGRTARPSAAARPEGSANSPTARPARVRG